MTSPNTDQRPVFTTTTQGAETESQHPACKDHEQVLRERARQLATRQKNGGWEETRQVVCFLLAGDRYALPFNCLARIEPLPEWTPVPGAPAELLGVTQLLGQVTPLLNLAMILDTDHTAQDGGTGLFLHRAGAYAGYLVDEIVQIQTINASDLEPRTDGDSLMGNRYISGRLDDGARLLRPESLLDHPAFKGGS